MQIQITVTGARELERDLLKVEDGIENKLRAVIQRSAKQIEAKARVLGGKQYPPASAPGSPPAKRSGRHIGSLQVEFTRGGMQAHIGPNAKHSKFVELGTRKMAARPLMPAALRAEEAQFIASILNCIKGL